MNTSDTNTNTTASSNNTPHASTKRQDPFASMLGFLQGQKPAYIPPEPIKRQRGWGGKSILEE